VWRESEPDDFDTYPDDTSTPPGRPRLPGIAGHGTFIAGIVAAGCPQADITVVGHRHEWQSVAPKDYTGLLRLFTTEFAIAYSVLTHPADDVISCGFAFPTLDAFGSIPFTLVMPHLDSGTAFFSPAGNEKTTCPHWPAAHPRAIGVAATTADGSAKADFSNWGSWLDCCSPGEDVLSTFGHVVALPQDYAATPADPPWTYDYWATWSGTSFAAPRVAAVIASMAAADRTTTARDHASALLTAASPVGYPLGPGQVDLPYVA
jgi:subtilisin family serine protease